MLSTLRYFFDIDEKGNAYLFDGLAVSKEKDICEKFQNRFPVISLTFKDIKGSDEKGFLNNLNDCLQGEYLRHSYVKAVLESASDRETYDRIMNGLFPCRIFLIREEQGMAGEESGCEGERQD